MAQVTQDKRYLAATDRSARQQSHTAPVSLPVILYHHSHVTGYHDSRVPHTLAYSDQQVAQRDLQNPVLLLDKTKNHQQ